MKHAILSSRKIIVAVFDTANARTVEISDAHAEQALALLAQKRLPIFFEGSVTDRVAEKAAGYLLRFDEDLGDWVRSPAPIIVPESIQAWQAQAALKLTPHGGGTLYDAVVAALDAMPDGPEKTIVNAAFEKDARFFRNSATIATIATALGISAEQMDALFVLGGSFSV
jgi:hypothetical protein